MLCRLWRTCAATGTCTRQTCKRWQARLQTWHLREPAPVATHAPRPHCCAGAVFRASVQGLLALRINLQQCLKPLLFRQRQATGSLSQLAKVPGLQHLQELLHERMHTSSSWAWRGMSPTLRMQELLHESADASEQLSPE